MRALAPMSRNLLNGQLELRDMPAFGAMETLSEQPQRSASGTTDAIHILQAIFQETCHFEH